MDQLQDYILNTELEGVFILKRPTFDDPRGFFRELFRKADLEKRIGFNFDTVQANHSRSSKDTLRGIHIAPWHKLVSVTRGEVQQIVVDFREGSATFGKYISVLMGEDHNNSVFVPSGCGNSFLVTSEIADYVYLASDYWAPGKEQYVIYNDPNIAIEWKSNNPNISDKDLTNKPAKEVFPGKF